MDQFPGNSRNRKPPAPITPQEPKKIEKIVVNDAILRKKPLGRRFLDTFFGGDANSVKGYLFMEILVPAVKDLIIDIVTSGAERAIFGETRSPRPRGYRPSTYQSGHVSYNRMSPPHITTAGGYRRDEPMREAPRPPRTGQPTDEVILATRAEAQAVLTRLFDLIAEYEQVTLNDFYSIVGITGTYADENYGWTDIRGAQIVRTRNGGYLLDLPRPEWLK